MDASAPAGQHPEIETSLASNRMNHPVESPEPSKDPQAGAGGSDVCVQRINLGTGASEHVAAGFAGPFAATVKSARVLDADVARKFIDDQESVNLADLEQLDEDAAAFLAG